ncbi:cobalamin biosynthesis protein [Gordonia sp. DT219]|uniref:cobalamin biosynthesis protein n=1 Tax=Gordonia sp. DT219 TaxID=3416658 RepID=UPI003CF633AB
MVLGYLLDRVLADPRRGHPVAGIGNIAAALERRTYADSRAAGLAHCAMCVSGAAAAGMLAVGPLAERREWRIAVTAAVTWAVLGGTTLIGVGGSVARRLDADDVSGARELVPSLCGRDPNALDEAGICRAAVESVAENTSDAAVGPLVWGALAGVPGLLIYRTANTLDAMIGHRTTRYARFGWAAARFDDALNLLPARLAGLVVVAVGPDRRGALRAWRADASAHPSPNAGVVEASFAGALGVRLGGVTVYPHHTENRPALGRGRPPATTDLRAALRLSRRVQIGALGASVVLAWLRSRRM